jgi:hypothetical protein
MTDLTKILIAALLLIAAAAIGYRLGVKRDVTHTDVDTVYVNKTMQIRDTITNWFPKYFPVYVKPDSSNDSVVMYREHLDTVLIKDKDTLSVSIDRDPYPVRYSLAFDLKKADSVKVIRETIYLDKQKNWLDKIHIGIGAGYGVFMLDGLQLDAAPNLNIGVYYEIDVLKIF